MDILQWARLYVLKNFSIIPLHSVHNGKCTCGASPCGDDNKNAGKHPVIKSWKEYQTRRATDDELEKWFSNGALRNIGIVTGAISGIAVVDFDSPEAVRYGKEHGFPPSPLVKTGKKSGYHAYYRYREGIRNFQKRDDLPGIDVRGDGGYVVAPSSIHLTGNRYEWVKGRGLDVLAFADFPETILKKPGEGKSLRDLYNGVSEGNRNQTLARLSGVWVKSLPLIEALEMAHLWNQRNNPPLPDSEVERTVRSIFERHHRGVVTSSEVSTQADRYKSFDPLTLPTGLTLQGIKVNIEWLIKGLLPKRAITVLHGRGGIGKTWLSLQMAESIASGRPFLGLDTLQAPVYYIDYENPLPVLVERVKALNIQHVYFWHISNEIPPPTLDTLNNDYYTKLPEGSLIIFDTFRSAHTGDENDSKDISSVLTVLKQLREKGYTILLLHHTSKGNDSRYKGSTAILDLCDHELNLSEAEKKEGEQDTYRKLYTPQKSRYQTEELTLDFDLDEGGFFSMPDQTEETLKRIYEIMSGLSEAERKKTSFIDHLKTELNISRSNIRRLLDKGTGKFWITKTGEHNAISYNPNPVCQFAAPYRGPQTEKLNLTMQTPDGKLTPENNPHPRMDTEFASLPEGGRQTEKLDLLEGEI